MSATETNREKLSKSKTFSRLRKLEGFICQETLSAKNRRSSMKNGFWANKVEQENRTLKEENENLKAIQNSLMTHLNLYPTGHIDSRSSSTCPRSRAWWRRRRACEGRRAS
jgi:hypothetical protein